MAYTSSWLLKKASNAKSSLDNAIVFYILVMMASMLAGAILYFLDPTTTGIIEGLGLHDNNERRRHRCASILGRRG